MVSYIAKLDASIPQLSIAELESLTSSRLEHVHEHHFMFSTNVGVDWKRLGLSRSIYRIIGSAGNVADAISCCSSNVLMPTYKVAIHDCGGQIPELKAVADAVYSSQEEAKVDIHNPHNTLGFFFTKNIIHVGVKVFFQDEKFSTRKSHELPGQHPTTMDPKLARAMINVSGSSSFHDPFCGSGGIVIEGAVMNVRASGSDIVPAMISRAEANAKHIGVDVQFTVADALTYTQKHEALVTDLPYGRNAALSNDKDTLYHDFFAHAQTLTNTMVCGTSGPIDELLFGTTWKIEKQFTVYVHKSLTRYISLLKLHDVE